MATATATATATAMCNISYVFKTIRHHAGWISFGENAADILKCSTGERLFKDINLFQHCKDPFMIRCFDTACETGTFLHSVRKSDPSFAREGWGFILMIERYHLQQLSSLSLSWSCAVIGNK